MKTVPSTKTIAAFVGAMLLLASITLGITKARSFFSKRASAVTATREMPRVVLWAWERRLDLRFIDPRETGVAFLARSTRYGCTDKETGRWSKAAYDLLHSRYPNTTWAKNTKYWFKG